MRRILLMLMTAIVITALLAASPTPAFACGDLDEEDSSRPWCGPGGDMDGPGGDVDIYIGDGELVAECNDPCDG